MLKEYIMAFSKNFDELFIKPEKKGEEWTNKLHELAEKDNKEELYKYIESAKELYVEEREIPVPIPNTEVKPLSADDIYELPC